MEMVERIDSIQDVSFNQDILGILFENTILSVFMCLNNSFIPISKENIYSKNISNSVISIKKYYNGLLNISDLPNNLELLITIEETINGNNITVYILDDKAINKLVDSELTKEEELKEYYDKIIESTNTSFVETSTGLFGYGLNNI